MSAAEFWLAAKHATAPTPVRLSRRQIRDAARLLTTQSQRGNRDADRLTAELHRAGLDLRDVGRFERRFELWLGVLALVISAAAVVAIVLSKGGWVS